MKLELSKKDFAEKSFQAEIKRLMSVEIAHKSKSKINDEMVAHAMKSRIQMKDVHEKATLWYVIYYSLICVLCTSIYSHRILYTFNI